MQLDLVILGSDGVRGTGRAPSHSLRAGLVAHWPCDEGGPFLRARRSRTSTPAESWQPACAFFHTAATPRRIFVFSHEPDGDRMSAHRWVWLAAGGEGGGRVARRKAPCAGEGTTVRDLSGNGTHATVSARPHTPTPIGPFGAWIPRGVSEGGNDSFVQEGRVPPIIVCPSHHDMLVPSPLFPGPCSCFGGWQQRGPQTRGSLRAI